MRRPFAEAILDESVATDVFLFGSSARRRTEPKDIDHLLFDRGDVSALNWGTYSSKSRSRSGPSKRRLKIQLVHFGPIDNAAVETTPGPTFTSSHRMLRVTVADGSITPPRPATTRSAGVSDSDRHVAK